MLVEQPLDALGRPVRRLGPRSCSVSEASQSVADRRRVRTVLSGQRLQRGPCLVLLYQCLCGVSVKPLVAHTFTITGVALTQRSVIVNAPEAMENVSPEFNVLLAASAPHHFRLGVPAE